MFPPPFVSSEVETRERLSTSLEANGQGLLRGKG